MTRLLPATVAVGLLAATSGPALGQSVPTVHNFSSPLPSTLTTVVNNPLPAFNGTTVGVNPFRPGIPVYGYGGFAYPFYGGGFYSTPYYPYYQTVDYSGMSYPGQYGATLTSLYDSQNPPPTGWVGMNVGPTPAQPPPNTVPLQLPAGAGKRVTVAVSGQQTATLTVALPAAGDVWLNGAKQTGNGTTYALTSPALRPGESHKFDVRAEWAVDGKRYRADRTVSVGAGDRQKLTLVLGDPIK